jgi:hypothetical protein
MNKDNAHLFLPLVQALAEGKTLQIDCGSAGWHDLPEDVEFKHPPHHYRAKPDPVFDWAVESRHKNGDSWLSADMAYYSLPENEMKFLVDKWNKANGAFIYRARKLAPVEEALT